jgi:acetyltransferase-like isoleucine patch superfamily enzyme
MKAIKLYLWRAFDVLALIVSYGFNFRISSYARLFCDKTYSYALGRRLKRAGPNLSIQYPAVVLGPQYIQIGDNFQAFARLRLEAFGEHQGNLFNPKIVIGNNVSMNYDCHIGCINRIVIGDNVLMGSRILITDHFHGEINADMLKAPPAQRKITSRGPVVIEDNVWIGEGVAIMPNVRIGRNSIIGANAVVADDLPPNCVAGGVPARVIRFLTAEQR